MPLDSTPSQQPWDKSYPKDLRWDSEIPELTMVEIFDAAVKKNKDEVALSFMGKTMTYGELGEAADRFAKGLQDQGVKKGTKVGLALPNSSFYPIAFFGALKAGATVVNFNPLYAEKEMEYQIKDSKAEVMVTVNVAQVYGNIEKALSTTGLKKIVVCDMADALKGVEAAGTKFFNSGVYNVVKHVPFLGKSLQNVRAKKKVPDLVKTRKNKNAVSFAKLLKSKGKAKPVNISIDDIAVLQYTGGTTGVPKAAMLSHGNIAANTQQTALWFTGGKEREKKDTILAVLPFFHVFSMTAQMCLGLHMGAKIAMLPQFDVKATLEAIQKEKPTIFAGVPTIYQKLAAYKGAKNYDFSSLEVCISGAAPLSQEVMQGFKELTKSTARPEGIDLLEGYGLSEVSAAALANPLHGEKKVGTIGLPLPQTEIKFVPLPDEDTTVKYQGEICLRGPQVMKGYWNRPDETKGVMDSEGFLHTGDVGRMDADGYVSIIGRTKDMIIASGLKVFPRKVEEAIMKHPAVADVGVIGVHDKVYGETVKAFIVLREGKSLKADELKAFLNDYLAPYEVPRLVDFRDALPLTMIGKPDKKALREEERLKAEAAEKATNTAAIKSNPPKNGGPKV